MRILIGSVEIAGIAANLKQGFEEAGLDAQTVFGSPHPFKYEDDARPSLLIRAWQSIDGMSKSAARAGRPFIATLLKRTHRLFGAIVLLWALARFDACIFLFGATLTNSAAELRLWRRLGKRIIFVYVGTDTRPPYMNGTQYPDTGIPEHAQIVELTAAVKARLMQQEKYANYCVNSPFSAQFHERPYINWFEMGLPRKSDISNSVRDGETSQAIRILHAPSRLQAKGTDIIRAAIEQLSHAGHDIDYVEIHGQPNSVVIDELRRCDFVVDQAYSDTPMAAFATEAASQGKPAVVGGYAAEFSADYIGASATPPSLYVTPDNIKVAIETLIVDRGLRERLGKEAQGFVTSTWSPRAVAERYIRLLNDDVPPGWWCNPAEIRYFRGAAVSEDRSRLLIARMIDEHGLTCLQLDDKPALASAIGSFAAAAKPEADSTEASADNIRG